jgi:hypothetical protein
VLARHEYDSGPGLPHRCYPGAPATPSRTTGTPPCGASTGAQTGRCRGPWSFTCSSWDSLRVGANERSPIVRTFSVCTAERGLLCSNVYSCCGKLTSR